MAYIRYQAAAALARENFRAIDREDAKLERIKMRYFLIGVIAGALIMSDIAMGLLQFSR